MSPYNADGAPYVPGSETSKRAAQSARERAPTQRARVLVALLEREQAGASCDELSVLTGIGTPSLCARLRELEEDDLIKRLEATRKTRKGEDACLYVLPQYVDGRPVIPYEPYILLSRSTFNHVLRAYDAEWREATWKTFRAHEDKR